MTAGRLFRIKTKFHKCAAIATTVSPPTGTEIDVATTIAMLWSLLFIRYTNV